MSGHTPVAWMVASGKTFVDRVYISKEHAQQSIAERKDGATLIALFAVPQVDAINSQLLDALREADRLYSTNALLANSGGCGAWINAARAAIAKAEGKS